MNAIVSFRKCTLSNEELQKKVDQLTDQICQTGKIPDRHIPARPNDDYDLLVGELIVRFMDLESQLKDITNVIRKAPITGKTVPILDPINKIINRESLEIPQLAQSLEGTYATTGKPIHEEPQPDKEQELLWCQFFKEFKLGDRDFENRWILIRKK